MVVSVCSCPGFSTNGKIGEFGSILAKSRRRSESKWPDRFRYESLDEFLASEFQSGLHSVCVGNDFLDIYLDFSDYSTTLVSFHASVADSATFPVVVGERVAREAGLNLIAFSDPSIAVSPEVRLGWFLGTRSTGTLQTVLHAIVKAVITHWGSKRVVFWGASGGGFAAIDHGRNFPGSVVLAVNPRVNLKAPPPAPLDAYLSVVLRSRSKSAERRYYSEFIHSDLATVVPRPLNFTLAIYQNYEDRIYRDYQFSPFVEAISPDDKLWIARGYDGVGHQHIPRERLVDILSRLSRPWLPPAVALSSLGFKRPSRSKSSLLKDKDKHE